MNSSAIFKRKTCNYYVLQRSRPCCALPSAQQGTARHSKAQQGTARPASSEAGHMFVPCFPASSEAGKQASATHSQECLINIIGYLIYGLDR